MKHDACPSPHHVVVFVSQRLLTTRGELHNLTHSAYLIHDLPTLIINVRRKLFRLPTKPIKVHKSTLRVQAIAIKLKWSKSF